MTVLTKDQILVVDDLKTEKVSCPEWKGDVYVRTMTGTDRDEFESIIYDNKDEEKNKVRNFRATLLVFSVVDEKGNRLFSKDDIVALGKKSGKALDRLFGVAQRLSRFKEQDVEQLTKKS